MHKQSPKDVVIFDLDGTLININSISHLLGDWEEFHPATFECPANEPMVQFALLCQRMDLTLYVVTGKPELHRMGVTGWLSLRGIVPDAILLRPNGNHMSDAELKPALMKRELGEGWKDRVLFALEDRDKMVDAWRATGIMCLQCAESLY